MSKRDDRCIGCVAENVCSVKTMFQSPSCQSVSYRLNEKLEEINPESPPFADTIVELSRVYRELKIVKSSAENDMIELYSHKNMESQITEKSALVSAFAYASHEIEKKIKVLYEGWRENDEN